MYEINVIQLHFLMWFFWYLSQWSGLICSIFCNRLYSKDIHCATSIALQEYIRFVLQKNLVQIKYLTEIEVGLLIGGVISKWDCHDTRSRIENWSKKHDIGSSNIFHEMCYFNHLRFIMGPKSFWTEYLISKNLPFMSFDFEWNKKWSSHFDFEVFRRLTKLESSVWIEGIR